MDARAGSRGWERRGGHSRSIVAKPRCKRNKQLSSATLRMVDLGGGVRGA